MLIDIRCREIEEDPINKIPEYFEKGWLGGKTLRSSLKNIYIYKKAKDRLKALLDDGIVSKDSYILAAEEVFLYGKAGMRVWYTCMKKYVDVKLHRKPVEDASAMFHEVKDIKNDIRNDIQNHEITDIDRADELRSRLKDFDKEHIWMFDAGHNGRRDFRGNPKYLFIYINKYRSDILAYWYCEADASDVIAQVHSLGFDGVLEGTTEAEYLLNRTGVVVSEQLREYLPSTLLNTKYLNLWHGIGFKRIERTRLMDTDDLRVGISKKYITYNSYFMNNQLLVVNSPIYEREFIEDFGISCEQIIRAGYLRCMYQQNYEPIITFEHNILSEKNLPQNTKLAVYVPTFRSQRGNAFITGMTNLDNLYQCCEENKILLIFKVHPHIEKEQGFLNAWHQYGDKPYFLFWDNKNDFYEIMDKIDLVIYDYSSIFSDFLCAGVKHFIRYIYDEEKYMAEGFTQGKDAYYERTCGQICRTFDELLHAISNYEKIDDSDEIETLYQKLWAYAGNDDFEKTIQAVFDFEPLAKQHPALYSFDVFDTLISRKGLHPYSIFYAVKDRMKKEEGFPTDFVERYPVIRHSAEMNVREYYKKTTQIRHSEKIEIQMQEIFERISEVYGITKEQSALLMEWEIAEELDAVVGLESQIEIVKNHIVNGDTVVLISDMYLPKSVIQKMLRKVEPMLGKLPLFVSSEYGVQKTSRLLYFEVYRSFKPFYSFSKWIHYGDNPDADKIPARKLGIKTRIIHKTVFNKVEQDMLNKLNSYNAYLFAAMCARLREGENVKNAKAEFVIDIIGATLISYVDWVIRDALEKGFECLYFIARDGYLLKLIADALIRLYGWEIDTKYLYASRRTWRIQSYYDEIDEIFWTSQGGNFNNIYSKEMLLKALYIDEDTFKAIFPQIDLDHVDWSEEQPGRKLTPIIQSSDNYREYLLRTAEKERILPSAYLKQELEQGKKFACVEFWGRGYNQECMTRLWNHIIGNEEPTFYYYARSIYPTEGLCVRYNMTDLDLPIAVMETVFANMPYYSIENYEKIDGIIKPVIVPNKMYDRSLFETMNHILPIMAESYVKCQFDNPKEFSRKLFDFIIQYIHDNKVTELIAKNVGYLKDNMSMYGELQEYARSYKEEDLQNFFAGIPRDRNTLSVQMSYGRSASKIKDKYDEMYQIEQGDDPAKGSLLNKSEIKSNNAYKVKFEAVQERALRASEWYEEACQNYHVYNKICVVSTTKDFRNDTLKILTRLLTAQQEIYVEFLSSNRLESDDKELMNLLAMAKYIIVDGNVTQLLNVVFRCETTCIRLLDRGFHLYFFGRAENVKLKWQYRYDAFVHKCTSSAVESTSKDCLELSGYHMDTVTITKMAGACVTDVLYDSDFLHEAHEKIESFFPEASGKKIIFYMPLPRKRQKNNEWLELLDLELLFDRLSHEYVLLVDFRSNNTLADNCKNIVDIQGFCKNVSKEKISLRSLLAASDIILGDYRDTFFESALLNKPVFSTAFDMDDVQSNSVNMMYDLREIYPFPIVKSSEELIEKINLIEEYDYAPLKAFKNQYLLGCDGHVAERILNYILCC